MKHTWSLSFLVAVGRIATATALPAQARTPRCFGQKATIVGTQGNDNLKGTSGRDVIVGRGGRDTISGGAGADLICGGPNPRKFADGELLRELLGGGAGNDRVKGGGGADRIFGGGGNDRLSGDRGSDDLRGDAGDDHVLGGPGRDFSLEAGNPTTKNAGDDFIQGGRGDDRLEEHLRSNLILGGRGEDYLIGGEQQDNLRGGKDRDVLAGNDGLDSLRGGWGRDVAEYIYNYRATSQRSNTRSILVNLRVGAATGMGRDRLQSIEGAWTGGGSDVLIGNSKDNVFYTGLAVGGSRVDQVSGRGGIDRLSFNDMMEGSCCTPVSVDLRSGNAQWGGRTDVIFASIENVTGSEDSDRILGNSAANVLRGLGDNDVIKGRRGRDRLFGGLDNRFAGDDILRGGRGDDKLRASRGDDELYGGGGDNRNNGGRGTDYCEKPTTANGAIHCESP